MRVFLIVFLCFAQLAFAESYIAIGGRIRDQVTAEVCKLYNLEVTGTGGAFVDELNGFTVGFECPEQFSRAKARKIFIEVRELYAKRVNECCPLRPYLHTYPFSPCEDAGIFLSFPENSEITLMLGSHGKIKYRKKNSTTGQYETLYEENYDEARAMVLGEKNKSQSIKDEAVQKIPQSSL